MSEERKLVLDIQGLGIDFGGLTAVNDLNLQVFEGDIAGLIGPNGAGKTTVFNMLTKVYQPTRGKIFFDGEDLEKKIQKIQEMLKIEVTAPDGSIKGIIRFMKSLMVFFHKWGFKF